MMIPNYIDIPIVDQKTGLISQEWKVILQTLLTQLTKGAGQEGFQISVISSNPASVMPTTSGGQLLQVQNTFGLQGGAVAGTIVFDPYQINGGSMSARNGQLMVLLADGVFHPITNT